MQVLAGLVFFLTILCLLLAFLVSRLHRDIELIRNILEELPSKEKKDQNDPKQYRWKKAGWKKIH